MADTTFTPRPRPRRRAPTNGVALPANLNAPATDAGADWHPTAAELAQFAEDVSRVPDATWRTLADIPDDPPGELLNGMLEPNGPTLFYGAPGVGKGTTASWLTYELQQRGMCVGIYDAERRPREWSRRIGGLG